MKKIYKRKTNSRGTQAGRSGYAKVIEAVDAEGRNAVSEFKVGDQVKVHVRIKEGEKERIQAYEGMCIRRLGRGKTRTFTVRKMSHGVGVERIFLEHSPKVAKVEVLIPGKVRRSKLYYLRALEGRKSKVERMLETGEAAASPATSSSTNQS